MNISDRLLPGVLACAFLFLNQNYIDSYWLSSGMIYIELQTTGLLDGRSFLMSYIAVPRPDAGELFTSLLWVYCA